jgi:hypothetical protein
MFCPVSHLHQVYKNILNRMAYRVYLLKHREVKSQVCIFLPRPQALIKIFHASHYMKSLHEVVHRDEQTQGVMGLRQRCYYPIPLCAPIM